MAAGPAMAALALALLGQSADAVLRVRAVDARTGAGVAARLSLSCCDDQAVVVEVPAEGIPVPVPAPVPGPVRLHMEAPGYLALTTQLQLAPGDDLPLTFEMDAMERTAARVTAPATGAAILHGYVVDAVTARPIAGAEVALAEPERRTTTDASGYFRFTLPEPGADTGRPALTTLRITAAGHGPHEVTGLLIAPGATLLREELAPGERPTSRDDAPRALEVEEGPAAPPGGARSTAAPPAPLPGGTALVPLDPPASIRLGTSCSCSTCAAVSVLSLETYVKRGLNDEWIASWNAHSLRAGAVAYRAYGTWYTQHPISPAYDICNTTCCQVNDTDTSSGTDAAGDRTAGYLLERGAAVFRAEYSAENNAWDDPDDGLPCSNSDLSCGDGSAGSPATGWTCLADAVDATHGCFGHGRGACQWGTQRWSLQGARWPWILDHYYNDHGAGTGLRTARMSTPMLLLQAAAPPRVRRGTTFTITARAANRAAVAHGRVLLGASLRLGSRVISDPPRDAPLVLPPGDSDVQRGFHVPTAARAGAYDVLVALYDDVDEDGEITGGVDLPLHLLVLPAAVQVCPSLGCAPPD